MNLNSWGMDPKIKNQIMRFRSLDQLKEKMQEDKTYIPCGNGRSYGDSALNDNIIYCKPYNYFLDFDENNGIIHCKSGVLLSEILEIAVPK
jgi:FAD/FMN-containing dehydrogenase